MPRKEKYSTHVKPHLEKISTWRKKGMKLDAIAKKLKINPDTLYAYQRKYAELSECLNTAQQELYADMVVVAEDSLFKKLQDRMEVVEEIESTWFDDDGNEHTSIVKKKRLVPADTTALIFALKNRNNQYWKDRTELEAHHTHELIPQPLAPVRQQDVIEAQVVEIESGNEAD